MTGRYSGVSRAAQRAKVRKLEGEARRRDESAPVAELSDNDIVSAIYRLQGRNRPVEPGSKQGILSARIRELVTERTSRSAG